MTRALFFTALLLGLLCQAPSVHARAYTTKAEALKFAFPDVERVETLNLFLTEAEVAGVAKKSGASLDSPLYTFYVGKSGESVTGYVAIEAATVRTHQETVMVTLNPDGEVRFVEILAFFEPEEYLPSKRWLDQFIDLQLSKQLRIGGDIQGITGATLSAQSVTRQVRKTAALLQTYLERTE